MQAGVAGLSKTEDSGRISGQGSSHQSLAWRLRPRYVHDRVQAAEANELCAAPQRLPQRSGLLTEAPLALPKTRQTQNPQKRLRMRIMHGACAPEEPEAAFPRAEVEHEVGDPIQPPPWRRATEQADVAMTTREAGAADQRIRADTWEPGASQGAIADTSSPLQLQASQAAAGEGRAEPP